MEEEINLRSYLKEAAKIGEIKQVSRIVDKKFELSAIIEKLEKKGKYPALFFKEVRGSNIPVVSNLFATRKRLAMALSCDEEDLNKIYREREDNLIEPVIVNNSPVQEKIIYEDEVDLYSLPIITHNEKDAAPYITAGAMVVKDPETGIRNIGIYRHMLHEKNTLGIHMSETSHVNYIYEKYCNMGKPMPVAITIGHHPAFYLGVLSFVPLGVDEYNVVGGIFGQPLRLVKCKTMDLEVPADGEIVIEGNIQPGVEKLEGPFGEYTTLYGNKLPNPVINVKAITMRHDAIYLDCFSGHRDHQLLGGTARLSTIFKTISLSCPTVVDVFMPPSGCCRFICYVKIRKRHEGEAKNAIAAAIAADPFIKYIIVVDEDINIYNDGDIIKAISTRLKPSKNVFVIPDAKGHPLDPTATSSYVVTKIGIDATKPLHAFPETVRVPGSDQINIEELFTDYKIVD